MSADPQQEKTYKWERILLTKPCRRTLTIRECSSLVRIAWRLYGLRVPPKVANGVGLRKQAHYSPYGHIIKLPQWARKLPIVLHETAHAIDSMLNGFKKPEVHGGNFVQIMISLYAAITCKEFDPMFNIVASDARKHGIRVSRSRSNTIPGTITGKGTRQRKRLLSKNARRMLRAITSARKDLCVLIRNGARSEMTYEKTNNIFIGKLVKIRKRLISAFSKLNHKQKSIKKNRVPVTRYHKYIKNLRNAYNRHRKQYRNSMRNLHAMERLMSRIASRLEGSCA